jgi:hypothetical protein
MGCAHLGQRGGAGVAAHLSHMNRTRFVEPQPPAWRSFKMSSADHLRRRAQDKVDLGENKGRRIGRIDRDESITAKWLKD